MLRTDTVGNVVKPSPYFVRKLRNDTLKSSSLAAKVVLKPRGLLSILSMSIPDTNGS